MHLALDGTSSLDPSGVTQGQQESFHQKLLKVGQVSF